MNLREFRRAGHWPTLLCAFLYFDISFAIWVMLGALANPIAAELKLSSAAAGLLVAVPLMSGSGLRLVLGVMADRMGARAAALLGLTATLAPLALGWLWADTYPGLLLVGLLLGVPGASFAAALPLASRWYPPRYQGLAMGIAGAGNSGTALAAFFAPRLAEAWGWRSVFGFALAPVLLALLIFALLAREAPDRAPARPFLDYFRVLRQRDTWWFCFFYAVTFGGFVGLASSLNIFFRDQFSLTRVEAGNWAGLCVIAGSLLRPVGGYLADRLGGLRLLLLLFAAVALGLAALSTIPALGLAILLLVTILGLLGMGNGAVFQLVPQRFPREIGVLSGVVGAAGSFGGFFLPTLLGSARQAAGSYSPAFAGFALAALAAAILVAIVSRAWVGGFVGPGGRALAAVESVADSSPNRGSRNAALIQPRDRASS